jgi:hypothetical protein
VCDKTTNHAVTAKYSLAWGEMLDLVESLWTVQALQERHFDSWFSDLKILHSKEVREYHFFFVIGASSVPHTEE